MVSHVSTWICHLEMVTVFQINSESALLPSSKADQPLKRGGAENRLSLLQTEDNFFSLWI